MLKHLLKNIFYTLIRFWPWPGAVVLMYHSVGDNPEFFTVTSAQFERQMAYLAKHHFKVIAVTELIKKLERGEKPDRKTVILTIDDGYEDNYFHIFSVLKRYNFPAAIFITTDLIGKFTVARRGTTMNLLSWSQINAMVTSGLMEFFSHSHTHPKLDQISLELAEKEIALSRDILEQGLHKKLPFFAYPYGQYNEGVVEILKRHNFEAAFTVKTGRIQSGDDPLLLRRNSIDSRVSFAMFKGIVKYGRL